MRKKPNLIMFGIDSLRRDHMSLSGYPRLTTPHMDKYAEGGTAFLNCFSPSIPTTPGYSSIFTGRDCFGTDVVALRHKGAIADGVPTLAEVLRAEGYTSSCVGFKGNAASRGFDTYIEFSNWGSYAEGRSPKADKLNEVTVPELHRLAAQQKPFFLMLRHMDPHSPYLPPAPFERMFYAGDEYDRDNRSLDACYAFKPFRDYFYTWFPPGCTDAKYIAAQYDAAVAYMDAAIQVLLQEIAALGLEEDTLVVITSDHGETLDEHDCYFDHHGLYDCTLSVPLIFRMPGRVPAGKRFDDTVQAKDIMPTILQAMDIPAEALAFDGRSLFGRMHGDALEAESEMYISECTWMRKHGWRTPQFKLIEALEPDFHGKPAVELYDLIRDPGENHNIAEAQPDVVAFLRGRMMAHIARRERETGRANPMYTNLDWHGFEGHGAFTSSEEAYNKLHIGDPETARKLQAMLAERDGQRG